MDAARLLCSISKVHGSPNADVNSARASLAQTRISESESDDSPHRSMALPMGSLSTNRSMEPPALSQSPETTNGKPASPRSLRGFGVRVAGSVRAAIPTTPARAARCVSTTGANMLPSRATAPIRAVRNAAVTGATMTIRAPRAAAATVMPSISACLKHAEDRRKTLLGDAVTSATARLLAHHARGQRLLSLMPGMVNRGGSPPQQQPPQHNQLQFIQQNQV